MGRAMRGLDYMIDLFGSIESVLPWAFRHQSHNPYGITWLGKNIVTPDMEPAPEIIPHEDLTDWGPDDYRTVASQCLLDCRKIVGKRWPIVVLAFDSYSFDNRIMAATSLHHRIKKGNELYPQSYFLAVAVPWSITNKISDKLLISLINHGQKKGHKKQSKRQHAKDLECTTRTERRWRENIISNMESMLDTAIAMID